LTAQSRFFYGYVIVAICFLIFMAIMGMITSFGLFFSPLIGNMGWTRTATAGAFSLNAIAAGIAGIVGGMLNDRFGPRIVLPLLGIVSVIGYLLVSQMNTIWQFYLFYGLIVGVGSNVYVPTMSTIARWFNKRRSTMSGIAFSGAGFGLLALPLFLNWVMNISDWRMSLIVISMIILVITILAAIFLRTDPTQIGLLPYGGSTKASESTRPEDNSFSFKEAIRTGVFWMLNLSLFCYGFCFLAFQVHIAVYANDVGISTTGAAQVLTALGAGVIAGQLGLGGIGDKIGYKKAYIVGLFCIVLALFTTFFARELWVFIIFAALLGLAFGNCSTQESPLVAWVFGLASHGTLLGIAAFSWACGGALGSLIFGAIHDAQGSYQYACWAAGIISVASVALSLFLKQAGERPILQSEAAGQNTLSPGRRDAV
jgi:MFS family permease